MSVELWVFGDHAEGTWEEARLYAAGLQALPMDVDIRALDRLSSRATVFNAVVRWGIVEPRVVVIENKKQKQLVARLNHFAPLAVVQSILTDFAGLAPCKGGARCR